MQLWSAIIVVFTLHVSLVYAIERSYDYIVVGGGLSGAVVASRLSEDANVTVLLLEAGGLPNIVTRTPVLWFSWIGSDIDWNIFSTPQEYAAGAMNNRQIRLTVGKILSGGSMINGVLWQRGTRHDFGEWVKQGATGWSFDDVLPYFIRSEDVKIEEFANSPLRGVGGPVTINFGTFQSNIGRSVVNAAGSAGYRTDYDNNGVYRLGFARVQCNIRAGLRVDSARAYIDPVVDYRNNLDVLIHSQVSKVLFDGNKRVIGIQYYDIQQSSPVPENVYARREVILCAGALNTPKILLQSGVGPAWHLQQLGIPVIRDLPVGENLMDHYGTQGLSWHVDQNLLATVFQAQLSTLIPTPGNLFTPSPGFGALLDGTGFINTVRGPGDPADTPDVQFFLMTQSIFSDFGLLLKNALNIRDDIWDQTYGREYGDSFTSSTVIALLMHPKTRGYVRLASRDPFDPPIVNPNYYKDARDLQTIIRGMKFIIDIFRSPDMAGLAPRFLNVSYPGCPYPADPDNDGYLSCLATGFSQSIYHYAGTCRMGDVRDPRSVVDTSLRVIGVNGVRVVDTSIFPLMISGNPQATAFMVAERAADMIRGWSPVGK